MQGRGRLCTRMSWGPGESQMRAISEKFGLMDCGLVAAVLNDGIVRKE